jgi:hypothetical protein
MQKPGNCGWISREERLSYSGPCAPYNPGYDSERIYGQKRV